MTEKQEDKAQVIAGAMGLIGALTIFIFFILPIMLFIMLVGVSCAASVD